MPWQPAVQRNQQAHDEPAPEAQKQDYFTPGHFYCVETICAPCGAVIAWAKFDKAESPSTLHSPFQSTRTPLGLCSNFLE